MVGFGNEDCGKRHGIGYSRIEVAGCGGGAWLWVNAGKIAKDG